MANRTACWKDHDGKTVERLADAIAPHIRSVFAEGGFKYSGRKMKQGWDDEQLPHIAPLVSSLLALDARGGYFTQIDAKDAMKTILDKKENHDLKAEVRKPDERV